MEFIVDKSAKTVTITAEFDADRELVWDAYTKAEILDKWWAPKPFTSRTKEMNFEEGGRRFYAMVSPDGQERWALQEYKTITPKTNFTLFNAFADEHGNAQLPGSDWDLTFEDQAGMTKVTVSIYNDSLERMETLLAMGFKEGITATHGQLGELLAELKQTRNEGAKKMKPAEVSAPSDREVLVKRSFDAPVDMVWRAYMEPDLLRRWCSGNPDWSMNVCEMDMRVGGHYRWRWRNDENNQEFGFTGEVLEIVQHARIVHTQIFDPGDLGFEMAGEPSIITVTFDETDGMTNVATSIKFASQADRDAAVSTGMTDGMEISYKQLDELLAEGTFAHARNET